MDFISRINFSGDIAVFLERIAEKYGIAHIATYKIIEI
jgi:hypothetical protein